MPNFISTQTYGEIFKSGLVYLQLFEQHLHLHSYFLCRKYLEVTCPKKGKAVAEHENDGQRSVKVYVYWKNQIFKMSRILLASLYTCT